MSLSFDEIAEVHKAWEEMDERLVRLHVEFFGEWMKS